ncbi:MAG: DUF2252 domain-containing protein [Janthinobacterium lividum]
MTKLSDRLIKFNRHLLPEMVQLKYKYMAQSPFRFFRGSCHLFYEDLSKSGKLTEGPVGWICGDLHPENFGSFKGNDRMVYFDINDFDESALAPLSWELARVVTSIFISFDDLKINTDEALAAAQLFLTTYSRLLSQGKALYIDPRTAHGIVKTFLKTVKKRNESELTDQIRDKKAKHLKIKIDQVKYFELKPELKAALIQHVNDWIESCQGWPENHAVKDVVFRVAGTGSIGLNRYMFLLQNKKDKKEYALLDMKQGSASSLAPYNPILQPKWTTDAERIIRIKYRMQNVSPALLSTTAFQEITYVFQEMQPMADKLNLELLKNDPKATNQVIADMALIVASAQLRSGGLQGSSITDELIAFGQKNDWQAALLKYAQKYAGQVIKDYEQFADDYKRGIFNRH